MTLELLTKQEVEENPAGQGREEPNQNPTLDPPKCVQPLLPYFWFERSQFIFFGKNAKDLEISDNLHCRIPLENYV